MTITPWQIPSIELKLVLAPLWVVQLPFYTTWPHSMTRQKLPKIPLEKLPKKTINKGPSMQSHNSGDAFQQISIKVLFLPYAISILVKGIKNWINRSLQSSICRSRSGNSLRRVTSENSIQKQIQSNLGQPLLWSFQVLFLYHAMRLSSAFGKGSFRKVYLVQFSQDKSTCLITFSKLSQNDYKYGNIVQFSLKIWTEGLNEVWHVFRYSQLSACFVSAHFATSS